MRFRLYSFPGGTEVTRAGQQGAGVGAGIAVRAPRGSQHFPRRAWFFLDFPAKMTGKQVKRIDYLRMIRDGILGSELGMTARFANRQQVFDKRGGPSLL